MKARGWTAWLLAVTCVLALGAGMAFAQEEGPILLPKPKPVARPAAPSATLLVMCDLVCNWKLDGKTRGRIAAGDSATASASPGQHVVIATTEAGADRVQQIVAVKANEQTVVSFELKQIHDARVKVEQEVRDKAEQEARDKAAREQQDKDRQERERAAREEAAKPSWTDPATGQMWTKKDNGRDVTWQQAMDYCQNLQLAGHSDWRLPTIDELQGVYDANANVSGYHVEGNLQLSNLWQWSSSEGIFSDSAWAFNFTTWKRISPPQGNGLDKRALCVRRP